jgi:antirestriction protein ArdC
MLIKTIESSLLCMADNPWRKPWNVDENKTFQPIAIASAVAGAYGTAQRIRPSTGNVQAFYDWRDDSVNMPNATCFRSSQAFYHCLFHELTHSTGIVGRLSRTSLYNNRGVEELTAELGAVLISERIAMLDATLFENSVAYLRHWLAIADLDKGDLHLAFWQASKASEFILSHSLDKLV